jgi:hypothetical protein
MGLGIIKHNRSSDTNFGDRIYVSKVPRELDHQATSNHDILPTPYYWRDLVGSRHNSK